MTNTLKDYDRRDQEFFASDVVGTLPEHYRAQYPTLVTFLEKYYEFMDDDETFGFARTLHDLFKTRDAQATPNDLLDNLLNEIGAGLVRRDFFIRPRAAARLLAFLYRLKGSLYSTETFFRLFYDTTAEISYPKRNIFIVNESLIGAESLSVIQDGELYQIYSILIKTDLPSVEWLELYKALAHPAGFYLGSEVLIVSIADLGLDDMPLAIKDSAALNIVLITNQADVAGQFSLDSASVTEMSSISNLGQVGQFRFTLSKQIAAYQEMTIAQLDSQYANIGQLIQYGGITADNTNGPDASNTIETMDQSGALPIFDSAIPFALGDFILATGSWNDNGIWEDDAEWYDGETSLLDTVNFTWNDNTIWIDDQQWIDSGS